MSAQRGPRNPTLAHFLPAAALLGIAVALALLGLILQLTLGASSLPTNSARESQNGVRIALDVAMYAGAAGVVALVLGMLTYSLDLMRMWSPEDESPPLAQPGPAAGSAPAAQEAAPSRTETPAEGQASGSS